MVNSLGNVTGLEMTLIVNDVVKILKQQQGVNVLRVVSGTLMSSLDMNGMSITVLKLNDSNKAEVLSYLDLPVDSPFWPGVVNMEAQTQNVIALGKKPESYDQTNYSASDDEKTKKFRAGFVNVL